MAIQVTCPGCMKRFNVSDKFAGKTGPCPSCQKQIKIPEKKDEIVIHAPDTAAPKDSKGRSILKPIRRTEVKLSLPVILAAALTTIVVFGIALGLRLSGDIPPTWLLIAASILLAPPLVFTGYWFLHDDELEGFRGRPLLIRTGVCALAFAAIWAVYALAPTYVSGHTTIAEISGLEMAIFIPIMIALGAAASVLIFELEVIQGVLHYMLYFGITFSLAWIAGTPLAQPLASETPVERVQPPAISRPNQPPAPPAAPAPEEPPRQVPKLLQ